MPQINPIHQRVSTKIFPTAAEASAAGYNYSTWEEPPKPIQIQDVVIVRQGTVQGNATVDFLLIDESGEKHVFLITQNLLKMLANLTGV